MKRHLITLAVAGGVLVGCGGESPKPPVVPEVVDAGVAAPKKKALAQAEGPGGEVTLERDAKKRPLTAEALYALDVIETGAEGTVNLRFANDRVVELGPEGRFELQTDGSGLSLNVLQGLVLTRINATPQKEEGDVLVTIATPFGLTRIGGAELSVKVAGETADVDVKLGEIELVPKNGESTRVAAGKKGSLGKVRELPEIALTVVVAGTAGKAEYKAKDAKTFVLINPKKAPALKNGDTVRVKEGRFSLAPDGSSTRVALLKGAEVGIVEARRGSSGDVTALDVRKGDVEVVAPAGQTTRLGVATGVALVSEGGQFNLRRTGTGFEVESLAGDVIIERDGEASATVPGGQSATVPLKGAAAVRDGAKEQVVLPARGVKLFHTGLKRLTVQWDDDGSKEWHFQLATDPSFANPVRDGLVRDAFASIPALPKGSWFWRVYKGPNKGQGEYAKGQIFFAPEPRTSDLSRLQNVVKAGAETTTILFQDKDKPPVVTFSWGKEEGAAKYDVKVYREGQLGTPVATRTVSESSMSLPENTLGEGKYLWSVTPLDAKGSELKGGRMNKLHMLYDNAVNALLIKTPQNGDAGGKTVHTSGVVPVGARLFVNGHPVELDAQARFDASVAPMPGGRLVYRLVTGAGESWTIRTVKAK